MRDEQGKIFGLHSSVLLYALQITSCGLGLFDDAIRVAVGMRLGLTLCKAHPCSCGTAVHSWGTHGLSCKSRTRRSTSRHKIDHTIWRAPKRVNVSANEPAQRRWKTSRRLDSGSLANGCNLIWYVTFVDTLANIYTSHQWRHAERQKQQHCRREHITLTSCSHTILFS